MGLPGFISPLKVKGYSRGHLTRLPPTLHRFLGRQTGYVEGETHMLLWIETIRLGVWVMNSPSFTTPHGKHKRLARTLEGVGRLRDMVNMFV